MKINGIEGMELDELDTMEEDDKTPLLLLLLIDDETDAAVDEDEDDEPVQLVLKHNVAFKSNPIAP